ncbi:MAG: hypothetical protein AMXMBFR34_12980 [Myxococcaceae bacterium]
MKDGVRYHHLIDPRTCRPATTSISAGVLAKTAVDAEFLTKAVFILGPKEGGKLAQKLGAAAALLRARLHRQSAPGSRRRGAQGRGARRTSPAGPPVSARRCPR